MTALSKMADNYDQHGQYPFAVRVRFRAASDNLLISKDKEGESCSSRQASPWR